MLSSAQVNENPSVLKPKTTLTALARSNVFTSIIQTIRSMVPHKSVAQSVLDFEQQLKNLEQALVDIEKKQRESYQTFLKKFPAEKANADEMLEKALRQNHGRLKKNIETSFESLIKDNLYPFWKNNDSFFSELCDLFPEYKKHEQETLTFLSQLSGWLLTHFKDFLPEYEKIKTMHNTDFSNYFDDLATNTQKQQLLVVLQSGLPILNLMEKDFSTYQHLIKRSFSAPELTELSLASVMIRSSSAPPDTTNLLTHFRAHKAIAGIGMKDKQANRQTTSESRTPETKFAFT